MLIRTIHQLVSGCNSVFENRTGKRGDGVGFYLKQQFQNKVHTDLTQNYTDLEILSIEIRNKNIPTLVCAVYQPTSSEKLEWLEKFDQFLANIYIYTTWNGVLIVTGDFNINLLSNKMNLQTYRNILHTFSLQQHVTWQEKVKQLLITWALTSLLNWYIVTSSALMKFQTTMNNMQYPVLKKIRKNDTKMNEMRKA